MRIDRHVASDTVSRSAADWEPHAASEGWAWRQCGPSLPRSNSLLGSVATNKPLRCDVLASSWTRDNRHYVKSSMGALRQHRDRWQMPFGPPVEKRGGEWVGPGGYPPSSPPPPPA